MVRIRIESLEEFASVNNIPIMQRDGIEFLTNYIRENNIKNILEIGSAIGYSAIKIASISSDIKVTTIERDKERYDLAVNNIKNFNLSDQINIINGDDYTEEIVDYIELTAKGYSKCMKWNNIKSLLNCAKLNNRLTQKQVDYIINTYNRD